MLYLMISATSLKPSSLPSLTLRSERELIGQAFEEALARTQPKWWHRVWTLQEVVVPSVEAWICFEQYTISIDILFRLELPGSSLSKELLASIDILHQFRMLFGDGHSTLKRALQFTQGRQATLPGDRIFGILSLLPPDMARELKLALMERTAGSSHVDPEALAAARSATSKEARSLAAQASVVRIISASHLRECLGAGVLAYCESRDTYHNAVWESILPDAHQSHSAASREWYSPFRDHTKLFSTKEGRIGIYYDLVEGNDVVAVVSTTPKQFKTIVLEEVASHDKQPLYRYKTFACMLGVDWGQLRGCKPQVIRVV
ncbi:hypothetical protein LTR78_007739 [Recurvomyces mirabilis]|uniref:Heterokaryon incompatibility domain-containing protein n=1 Tax=Recurvomyces mirabilis TaxID=574656 RepID=A0AAE0TUL0_9PEZI|nr:hypothetical protein LTR78_007739 [Recurvomyces mirabilis]KAK5151627.1 hypothetical protein LTS14_009114 [Recurvomyces mirabilis]